MYYASRIFQKLKDPIIVSESVSGISNLYTWRTHMQLEVLYPRCLNSLNVVW